MNGGRHVRRRTASVIERLCAFGPMLSSQSHGVTVSNEHDPRAVRSGGWSREPSAPGAGQARLPPEHCVAGRIQIDPQLLVAVIGQAAALLAAAAAVVYAAGAISLAFKLWYDGVPVLPVIVQLPRTWSFTQAIAELLPLAVAVGLLAVFIWKRVPERSLPEGHRRAGGQTRNHDDRKRERTALAGRRSSWPPSSPPSRCCSRKVLFISPLIADGHQQARGALAPRPWWSILLICIVLDVAVDPACPACPAQDPGVQRGGSTGTRSRPGLSRWPLFRYRPRCWP